MSVTSTFRPEDLPLLGEPLPIELANTLYVGVDEVVDFLGSPADAQLWLRHVAQPTPLGFPSKLGEAERQRLVDVRKHIRDLLALAAAGRPLLAAPVRALNATAALAPSYAFLELGEDGGVRVVTRQSSPDADGLMGRLAHEAIVLLGTSASLVRHCGAPGCPMYFWRNHHRRRWCHPSCGHRTRQAAYYRRQTRVLSRKEQK